MYEPHVYQVDIIITQEHNSSSVGDVYSAPSTGIYFKGKAAEEKF
jgi:hypothetical protein